MEQKKIIGQYFTTNIELKETIFRFIQNKPNEILEPCIGRGDLVKYVQKRLNTKFDMYEIDSSLQLLKNINKEDVVWCDFLEKDINKKYTTIIGNPPYIKTTKGNIYIDFIIKCFNLLAEKGELIFIVPSDFFKLTSSSSILDEMMKNGTFTHIYHPHNERLFKEARIDVLIFRYCKNKILEKKCLYNGKCLYICNNNGLVTFHKNEVKKNERMCISDLFNIHVGIVCGRESIYKNKELGNIKVLVKENTLDDYILITEFPCDNDKINNYLLNHKNELINRKIKKFNEKNWYQWGALRNIKQMLPKENELNECIYVYRLTRNENIAFKSKVTYFGSQLIMLKPKNKFINLDNVITYLNSSEFKQNFVFSGRFKIGHRQLSNSYIPNNDK